MQSSNVDNVRGSSNPQGYVLSFARGVYLLIAIASLVVMIGGTAFIIYLQAMMFKQPSEIPIPPPYQRMSYVAHTINHAIIAGRLAPPKDIRFVVTTDVITALPNQNVILGYFTANTKNNLASFPDGISIIGGKDSELFEKALDSKNDKIGLKAKAALTNEITELLRDIKARKDRIFEIRVAARDQYGIISPATDIRFVLTFGPALDSRLDSKSESQPEITELQKVAGDIAKVIEPTVNPAYVSAYRTALGIPRKCGTHDSDQVFITNYRQSLEKVRSQLTSTNIVSFYVGLCEAWEDALQRESERESAEREHAEKRREHAQEHNRRMLQRHEYDIHQARESISRTLTIIGSAVATFLSISIILAFMALENHSRAIREAMESMVRISEEKKITES